jgi:hypothetical protein
VKILKNTLIIVFLIIQFTSYAWASTPIYTIQGSESPGEVQLGILKNNESMEIEFKLVSKNYKGPNPENNSEILLATRQKSIAADGRIILKHVAGRWCLFYYPPGSESYARKYYVYIPMNEDGTNRIKIERKKDWVSYYFNKKLIGGIPLKPGEATSLIQVYNMVLEYRWTKQNFNTATAKNPQGIAKTEFSSTKSLTSTKPAFAVKDAYAYVPGGNYRVVDTKQELKDGDTLRFTIEIKNVLKDPNWANSISLNIDKTQIWMNESLGTYGVEFNTASGDCEQFANSINLDKKPNTIDIKRKGDKISVIVNGKKIGSYIHSEATELTDDYHVSIKFVGMEVKYGYEKLARK